MHSPQVCRQHQIKVTIQYSWGQSCHLERPGQDGGMDLKELRWNSARTNAYSCIWQEGDPCTNVDWGLTNWVAALLKRRWRSCQAASSTGASNVPWQQWRPAAPWAVFASTEPAEQGKWLHPLYSGLQTEYSSGLPSTWRTLTNWSEFTRGPQRLLELKDLPCEEMVRELGLFSLEKNWPQGGCSSRLTILLRRLLRRSHCLAGRWETTNKLKQDKILIGYKELILFLTMRAVKHYNRLLREAVQSSDLEAFKIQLDKALSKQAYCHSWPCFEQEAGPEVPSKPILWFLWFSAETLFQSTQDLIFF